MRILVAEDDATIRTLIETVLRDARPDDESSSDFKRWRNVSDWCAKSAALRDLRGIDYVALVNNDAYVEPGMMVSSIKRPEVASSVLKRADRVACHTQHGKPLLVASEGLEVPEHAEDKGWGSASDIDWKKFPTLPELIVGRAVGRGSDGEVTVFLNNLGLGYQFAAAGAVVYRKAKEKGVGHELPTDWFTEDVHP